jgi:hypothetical protein
MSVEAMLTDLAKRGRPLSSFHKGDTIEVSNRMVSGYSYTLAEEPGTQFAADFKPYSTPGEILALGAFDGKYLNDAYLEFPAEWFIKAAALDKLRPEGADVEVNLFKIRSRLPLSEWQKKGWAPPPEGKRRVVAAQYGRLSEPRLNPDERGWFQWYCRYWMGRRIPELDAIQIKRWKAFVRHAGAVKAHCAAGDFTCRPKQRQALLQWAHNPFI